MRELGVGGLRSFAHRFIGHLCSATQRSQEDTVKPVGRHFRLPGHQPHTDIQFIPIEKISDPFTRKARESFYIKTLKSLKKFDLSDVEHGLNLSRGQTI